MIYKDDLGTLCRRWNWKEAERTKLTAETRHAFLVIEGLPPVGRDLVERAAGELRGPGPRALRRRGGGGADRPRPSERAARLESLPS